MPHDTVWYVCHMWRKRALSEYQSCFIADAYVDALEPDHHYTLPASAADDCYCNTVFYSVMAACSACQDDEFLP